MLLSWHVENIIIISLTSKWQFNRCDVITVCETWLWMHFKEDSKYCICVLVVLKLGPESTHLMIIYSRESKDTYLLKTTSFVHRGTSKGSRQKSEDERVKTLDRKGTPRVYTQLSSLAPASCDQSHTRASFKCCTYSKWFCAFTAAQSFIRQNYFRLSFPFYFCSFLLFSVFLKLILIFLSFHFFITFYLLFFFIFA